MIRERRRDRDSGVLSISFALVFPVVLFLVLFVVQTSLLWYSNSVALGAAREAVEAGRSYNATDQDARDRATGFLGNFGNLVGNPFITPARTGTQLSVTVQFDPMIMVPGLDGLKIKQTASGPIERPVGVGQ
ncbi:Flp pilus assembly protein TadG [Kitasatospora sp. MAP12-15]|uniref:TadE/TadG family type IV pilus assembly protein n=1 Tax=unclassified Kitasatospora TaxID=2633591 RepID=UPI002476CD1D|nr:TadE/TadG family type IV pilus assembly protein [Kitasatospora sp. MAP12-44]MDH6114162.1 Flp pilus assembly protein TadG [Kitasatospora sp. MAP12-44]